jgi:6-pyruvoyltetrahydropterin/6-carboxytetrahydropterin synthase
MFTLSVKDSFSAAHRLEQQGGKCEDLHGHNFGVEVLVCGEKLDANGMIIDFGVLKGYLREVLSVLDHNYLNENPFFLAHASSSEYIAMYVFGEMKKRIKESGVSLRDVKVWESENACATYGI